MQWDAYTIKHKSQIPFTVLGRFGVSVLFIAGPIACIAWRAMTRPTSECPASCSGCSLTVTRALEVTKVAK